MKRSILVIINLVLGANILLAQSAATPLSMQACMDYALQHNYSIKNAELDVLIQMAQNDELLSGAYPHVNGSAAFNDYVNPPVSFFPNSLLRGFPGFGNLPADGYTSVPFTPKYSSTASISASQVLYDANVSIALKARNTVIELARQNSELTYENIKYNVYKAYNSLVIAYRQYDILKISLETARNIEHDILLTQQNGFAEKIDLERSTVAVNNLATDSIRIQNNLTFAERVLKYYMGMDINTPIILTDTILEERKKEANSLLLAEKSYDNVPTFNFLQTQLKLNEFNVRRYKLTAWPTLSAIGSTGYNYAANDFVNMTKTSNYVFNSLVGLQLNVPIYNGHLRMSQLREAKLNEEKAHNAIENYKQTIDFTVTSSRTTLQNIILGLRSQKNNLELADDVLDLARKKYKAGIGSNLEVTQAQSDLLREQNNYFSLLLDLVNAEAALKKDLGLLR